MNAPQGRIKRKPIPPRQPAAGDEGNHSERAVEPLLAACEDLQADAAHPETSSASSTAAADTDSIATCQHEYECPDKVPRHSGRESRQSHWRGVANRVLKGWWKELACCAISIVSLMALVLFLRAFDGEPLPSWPSGITINTVVAFLATISRTAFVIPVVEGLSQAKWNWFRKKPRPLDDFDAFDRASRGPWGSVTLLFRTKGWLIGVFSAVLFVTSIATSTLTQSVVSYPSRHIPMAGARAWKMEHYQSLTNSTTAEGKKSVPTLDEDQLPQQLKQLLGTELSTAPRYVSNLLNSDSVNFGEGTNLTLPNGVNMIMSESVNTVTLSLGPSLAYNDTRYHDVSVFNYFVIAAQRFDEHPLATEVVFHWCVDTYDAYVVNNILSIKRVWSHTEAHSAPTANVTYLTSPADEGGTVSHTAEAIDRETIRLLRRVLSGTSKYEQSYHFSNGADMLMHAFLSYVKSFRRENLSNAEEWEITRRAWWEAVGGMAQKYTTGITNSIPNVNGTAWQREVYVKIRWQWLTLLAAQVLLSVLLLAMIIMETIAADVDVVKSSMLAALFAISAEEKTALEKDIAEGKPLLPDGQDNHRPVVPAGIAGELRKEAGGKWVLGGSNSAMGQCVSSSSDDGGVAATGAVGAAGGNSGNNNNTSADAEPRYCQEPGCQRTTTTTASSTSTARPSRYCAQHAATCRRQGCSRPRYRKGPYCQEHLHTCRVSRCSNDQAKVLDTWFANSLCLEHQPASTLQAYHHQYYHNADETAPAQSTVVESAPPQKQQRARRRRKPKAELREGDEAGPRETRLNLPIVGEHPTPVAAAGDGSVTPPRRKQQEEEEEDVPDTPRRSQKTVHFADSTEPLTSHARHHHRRRRTAEDGRSRASPRTSGHSVTGSQSHAREKRSSAEAKRSRTRVDNR
ncbi:hypothetical protein CPLU01_01795 [Colletotrichum plurivorum]|uniref:Uncharacterized protein n=1 Tax=Colletotrichum plurivorum TaxID=2175906 RepID=A0A8H6NNK2_9PEZI|nr:hypothetical protein CPLU01_01795 [Colletotrichum plurivorum]